jgi:quinolinate synthase
MNFPVATKEKFVKKNNGWALEFYVFSPRPLDDLLIEPNMPKLSLMLKAKTRELSINAKQIVESFAKEQKIIFGPDKNLGNYINSITGRDMLLWDGACHVHSQFSLEKIVDLKKQYPDALILAHPECKRDILLVADKVGSTAALLRFATQSDCKRFIVATESGILHEMKKNNPDKEFIPAPPNDSTCACNECNFMRLNTMKKLYNTLKYELPEVIVDKEIAEKAIEPIQRMLDISASLGI